GTTPRALATEFGGVRSRNVQQSRPVYHCSLRLPAGERLTEEHWAAFSRDYLGRMGFTDTPYVVVRHAEDHVHIIASRVRCDGTTVSNHDDRPRSNRVVHELERAYGLSHAIDPERMRQDRDDGAGRPRVTRDEIGVAERTGEVPPKLLLAARIDEAITRSGGTREGFDRALAGVGVVAHWNIASTGRVSGASFELADYQGAMQPIVKGSQIGKDYSWMRLAVCRRERRDGLCGGVRSPVRRRVGGYA
ncbi:MAG: relaxase/mobilization nuclease domain-containing protein, partial [Chloroflexota bacterium]|nr:relaxase/mobilization nuclease domain-containing protein [Chloroflexota bacterium]